jgi:hypothetical protein
MSLIDNLSLHNDERFRWAQRIAQWPNNDIEKELRRLEGELSRNIVELQGVSTLVLTPQQIQEVSVKRYYLQLLWHHRLAQEVIAQLTRGVPTFEVDRALIGAVEQYLIAQEKVGKSAFRFGDNLTGDAYLFVTQLAYLAGGRKIYEISPGLAQRLRLTEVHGIKGGDLHLPYPAMYISVPREAELLVPTPKDSPNTKHSPLDGLLVREAQTVDPKVRRLRIIAANLEFPEDLMFEGWIWMEMPIYDDVPLVESLENFLKDAPDGTSARYPKQWREVFQWTMNVVLYSTMSDIDLETFVPNEEARRLWKKLRTNRNPKQRSKAQRALNQLPHCTVRRLGGKIVVDRTMSVEALLQSNDGKALNVRVLVAGHHKWQACGKNWKERKRILIEPYWRGPDDAPLSESRHRLEARGTEREA